MRLTHWAHPRSRGENSSEGARPGSQAGSSPLTRGKHAAPHSTREQIGLIPAHAGKTLMSPSRTAISAAHPRSRGENGPAPHSNRLRRWLIPAHAGKTPPLLLMVTSCWAHPRSRGENSVNKVVDALNPGSSPLTRGKLGPNDIGRDEERLIPAHAGKTVPAWLFAQVFGAHPRSRGEN